MWFLLGLHLDCCIDRYPIERFNGFNANEKIIILTLLLQNTKILFGKDIA